MLVTPCITRPSPRCHLLPSQQSQITSMTRLTMYIELAKQVELVVNYESLFSFNPSTNSPPDWWRPSRKAAVSCDRVDWGHHACFQAGKICYRAELKKSGKPPLVESQSHVGVGAAEYTVDKPMGELTMIKVDLRKTTVHVSSLAKSYKGMMTPLILCHGTPREAWLHCCFLQIRGC